MEKIVHMTSVHPRHDIRIFLKQCRSLSKEGYSVTLIVADGKGDETRDGVSIIDAGATIGGRLSRMLGTTKRVYAEALKIDADLYHLHDPELLPVALKLKLKGKKVIFDSHEDYPGDINTKAYIRPFFRKIISKTFYVFETFVCTRLDHVVAATPGIEEKFRRDGCKSTAINNYPLLEELSELLPWDPNKKQVCYIGAMTSIRGLPELVTAMQQVKTGTQLALAGEFIDAATEELCTESGGWKFVDNLGFVSRDRVREVMGASIAGIVTFLPAPNHIDAQPNKMFEYMSAGIPIIASHFPLWRSIIESNNCGICVDPSSPSEIATAIDYCATNPEEARIMGERGRSAVLDTYNWDSQVGSLVTVYRNLLGTS